MEEHQPQQAGAPADQAAAAVFRAMLARAALEQHLLCKVMMVAQTTTQA
jgi:hypothetical protein